MTAPNFHHVCPFSALREPVLRPRAELSDRDLLPAYRWWETEFGFYPLFLAVGPGEMAYHLTGYGNQFRRVIGTSFATGKSVNVCRPKGDDTNNVMLSFDRMEGIAHNFDTWCYLLCTACARGEPAEAPCNSLRRQAQKPLDYWVQRARRARVQLCAKEIRPLDACRVWVRNRTTQREAKQLGFRNVQVVRMPAR